MTTAVVLVLTVFLAAANGSNDVPKGVATLAGAGVTKYRTAIVWGTCTTLVGCLFSLWLAAKMTALFSNGIITAQPTATFAVAVLLGTACWVALATVLRLPVSTTHALVGALIGAGILHAADSVRWSALLPKVVQPLLLSIVVAYGLSVLLASAVRALKRRTRNEGPGAATAGSIRTGRLSSERIVGGLHWVTSGLACLARGLNDTPKIVAVGAFALVPAGFAAWQILLLVTAAMAAGSLVAGTRVAERLAKDVVRMSHHEGFTANLTTATLVGLGAWAGLPMSTTQVSTGAIAGSAGLAVGRINVKTLRQFAIAWLVTPPFAGLVAAGTFLLLR
ncbi:inorganic phosphate transporter, PiT family [Amycolatopsis tolypomycina]|uniref:Inorganic phosphate transporter, PiT family n=1 Tax=Amycolatopsis tolypomycina TaxID=208445 RepID=A0A1H4XYS5_9PSEU|nr:inorganic phosphate transporter [Amycolatopsis tolypomycina]SED10856.1 inorganic phosphate transporter, PiT family [Amycolatopsis tolypomycina]